MNFSAKLSLIVRSLRILDGFREDLRQSSAKLKWAWVHRHRKFSPCSRSIRKDRDLAGKHGSRLLFPTIARIPTAR